MWKGKLAVIELSEVGTAANIWRDGVGEPEFTVYEPGLYVITDDDGIGVHTDPRVGNHIERRYMAGGVMAGLDNRPTHLPGRFVICKAIGLAVHLGASRIELGTMEGVTDRARRNLETMVRPLKSHKVHVFEPQGITGLFTKEPHHANRD